MRRYYPIFQFLIIVMLITIASYELTEQSKEFNSKEVQVNTIDTNPKQYILDSPNLYSI